MRTIPSAQVATILSDLADVLEAVEDRPDGRDRRRQVITRTRAEVARLRANEARDSVLWEPDDAPLVPDCWDTAWPHA